MRTKVFFFLWCMLLFVACGSDDDAQEDKEKPISEHLSEIQNTDYYMGTFLGYLSDDGKTDVYISVNGYNDVVLRVIVDSETMPKIPGRGKIKKVWIEKVRKLNQPSSDGSKSERLWRMESVNYGRYAFKGGTAEVQVLDEERCQMTFSFGPIVDNDGVIESLNISCKCPMYRQGYY